MSCDPYDWGDRLQNQPRNGTMDWPFLIDMETLHEMREWVKPYDIKLEWLPKEEQEAFIAECREEIKRRWPWWYPYCYVHVA